MKDGEIIVIVAVIAIGFYLYNKSNSTATTSTAGSNVNANSNQSGVNQSLQGGLSNILQNLSPGQLIHGTGNNES